MTISRATSRSSESEHSPNVMSVMQISEGDADAAWAECDVIVEGEYETQAQCHTYMEPCSAIADIDANGKVTVWSGNQSVFHVQGQRRAGAGHADVQGALHHATRRRRVRRQDGADGPADRRRADADGQPPGQADADPRAAGFRDDPRAPSRQGAHEDRRQERRHAGRARRAYRAGRRRLCRRQSGRRRDLCVVLSRPLSHRQRLHRLAGGLHQQAAAPAPSAASAAPRSPSPAKPRSTRSPKSSASIPSICGSRTPCDRARNGCAASR